MRRSLENADTILPESTGLTRYLTPRVAGLDWCGLSILCGTAEIYIDVLCGVGKVIICQNPDLYVGQQINFGGLPFDFQR